MLNSLRIVAGREASGNNMRANTQILTDDGTFAFQLSMQICWMMWDVLYIFIFYLIQHIEGEKIIDALNYPIEVVKGTFQMCKCKERPSFPNAVNNLNFESASEQNVRLIYLLASISTLFCINCSPK